MPLAAGNHDNANAASPFPTCDCAAGPADAILYREISAADFRATSPPQRIADHASEFGAFTCARIAPASSEQRVDIATDASSSGYIAHVPIAVFHAQMDRGCSWWNPAGTSFPPEYVLQHEQIHFALAEVEAQRLTEEVRELRGRGSTPESAAAALQRSAEAARTVTRV